MRLPRELRHVDACRDYIVGDTLKTAQSQNLRAGWIKGSTVAGHAATGFARMPERSRL